MVKFRLLFVCALGICILGIAQVDAGDGGNSGCVCLDAGFVGEAYGECNKYCEELNCDAPNPNGTPKACNISFDRFFDLAGEVPPCEPVCPCGEGWLNPEFVPEVVEASSCYIEISDGGKRMDVFLEGGPDENGQTTFSGAGFDIFDDADSKFHRVGCFSEREDANGELSEDSGGFDLVYGFAEETKRYNRLQRSIFKSCRMVFKRVIKASGAECELADLRGQ